MKKLKFPNNKKFAFTIVDDTDGATLEKNKPVYAFLYQNKLITTKTVWVYPPKDYRRGDSLQIKEYLKFIRNLKQKGYEIALHGVGSGNFSRQEILEGLEFFKNAIGEFPVTHINHSSTCLNNIYWGAKRYEFPFDFVVRKLYPLYKKEFYGEVEYSPYFWGDVHKRYIKYTRNHDLCELNLLKFDPNTPYLDKAKIKYSNFWFSSANAANPKIFNKVVTFDRIDRLERENGVAILYMHLARFVSKSGKIKNDFKEKIKYIAQKDGWFVPASTILDFLLAQKVKTNSTLFLSKWSKFKLDFNSLLGRFIYRYIYKIG